MNANSKIILSAPVALILLLFVFAAVMLFLGIRQFGEAEDKLEAARNTLNSFYKKDPFPSRENVKVVNENISSMEQWMTDITDVAKRKQIDPAETRSPLVFANMLGKVKNGLMVKAQQHHVAVDKDFGFGFDAYVEGKPATPGYVPRLIQQLMIVNGICNVMISEGTAEIIAIEREQFEVGVAASSSRSSSSRTTHSTRSTRSSRGRTPARNTAPGQKMRRAVSIPAGKAPEDAGEFSEEVLNSKMKFNFTVSAKEEAILDIINKLALAEMFIVIKSVDI